MWTRHNIFSRTLNVLFYQEESKSKNLKKTSWDKTARPVKSILKKTADSMIETRKRSSSHTAKVSFSESYANSRSGPGEHKITFEEGVEKHSYSSDHRGFLNNSSHSIVNLPPENCAARIRSSISSFHLKHFTTTHGKAKAQRQIDFVLCLMSRISFDTYLTEQLNHKLIQLKPNTLQGGTSTDEALAFNSENENRRQNLSLGVIIKLLDDYNLLDYVQGQYVLLIEQYLIVSFMRGLKDELSSICNQSNMKEHIINATSQAFDVVTGVAKDIFYQLEKTRYPKNIKEKKLNDIFKYHYAELCSCYSKLVNYKRVGYEGYNNLLHLSIEPTTFVSPATPSGGSLVKNYNEIEKLFLRLYPHEGFFFQEFFMHLQRSCSHNKASLLSNHVSDEESIKYIKMY